MAVGAIEQHPIFISLGIFINAMISMLLEGSMSFQLVNATDF